MVRETGAAGEPGLIRETGAAGEPGLIREPGTAGEPGLVRETGVIPRLLLHCCCAPCASYVLEYLSPDFEITVFFFNPNIRPRDEYIKRAGELHKLLASAKYPNAVGLVICDYDTAGFDAAAAPYWSEPEGGRRCRECFALRLNETARRAVEGGFDYFATTLSVSPHKNAAVINEIGSAAMSGAAMSGAAMSGAAMSGAAMSGAGAKYLAADFKKRDGYKRSVELSKMYDLYRQRYCGCIFEK